jgi:hypothetical protein
MYRMIGDNMGFVLSPARQEKGEERIGNTVEPFNEPDGDFMPTERAVCRVVRLSRTSIADEKHQRRVLGD